MKIYTKTGDKGKTSLLGGARVSKAHERIEAYGTVDELNAHMGLLRDQEVNAKRSVFVKNIQDVLFALGSNLAADPAKEKTIAPVLKEEDITVLEQEIDRMNESLPEMRNFILPGGHPSVSFCHIARCVCRRAERLVIGLSEKEAVPEMVIKYLNRLSDYLFVLSRKMARELQAEEVLWKPRGK